MTQSLAILEWLEETHPEPPLLPQDPRDRATVRAMAEIVACDIHPINNLRILRALEAMGVAEKDRMVWVKRWINDGFQVLEAIIDRHGKGWSFGDTPTLADCCLVPQIYNSQRFGIDLTPYPLIAGIYERRGEHPAFAAAEPTLQPDHPPA